LKKLKLKKRRSSPPHLYCDTQAKMKIKLLNLVLKKLCAKVETAQATLYMLPAKTKVETQLKHDYNKCVRVKQFNKLKD
jgi:hypothetical protein